MHPHPRAQRLLFPDPGPEAAPSVLRVRPAPPPPRGPDAQPAVAAEPRELWIAAHVADLPVAAFAAHAGPAPLVVVDPQSQHSRVLAADERARDAGVRCGMTLAAALTAAPGLDVRPRDPAREQALMQHLADIAATFSPRVTLEPPDGLLLEIKPSIALFGGLRALCGRLRDAARAHPALARAQPRFALAPTPLAALLAARAGARCFITDPAALPARLKPLPLAVLRWSEDDTARLAAMGVRTLGELLRLPRAGFARRFGPRALAELDRLTGRRADPRARVARRERYHGQREFDHELEDHARILAALAPLLVGLEDFLRARQRGITALQCRFHHYRAPVTRCTLRFAQPVAEAARIEKLLAERLAVIEFPEPVRRCELLGGALTARTLASRPLWSPGERGHASAGEMPALVEQLRARLGSAAVHGLARVSEHRPEHAWRNVEPVLAAAAAAPEAHPAGQVRRPPWLLATPQELGQLHGRPRHDGALALLSGPERIEGGWWSGIDVARDYYRARDVHGAHLWIYRECDGARRWFLHGIFG